MIIPIRCFTCGKVVADCWDKYCQLLQAGYTEGQALDKLGLERYCCRRMVFAGLFDILKMSLSGVDPCGSN